MSVTFNDLGLLDLGNILPGGGATGEGDQDALFPIVRCVLGIAQLERGPTNPPARRTTDLLSDA